MPVSRVTDLVTVVNYATKVTLVPAVNHFTNLTPADGPVAPWPPNVTDWAFVPTFQRGIAWSRTEVEELIASGSEVFGTTVWGTFPWNFQPFDPAPAQPIPHLNYYPTEAIHLTDGLQRFTTATALLISLDRHGAFNGGALSHALPRLSQSLSPQQLATARFNHHVLANYSRPALARQYLEFFTDVDQWVGQMIGDANWLARLEVFFLDRRIGVDIYTGFAGPAALASNFVGINTGGQQLGDVDIFRALIIEDGLRNQWPAADALTFDTDLSSVLVEAEWSTRITPLASQLSRLASRNEIIACLEALGAANGNDLRAQTAQLLERLEPYTTPPASGPSIYAVPAIDEIFRCGKLPLSLLAALELLPSTAPWHLETPSICPDADLIVLVRAMYRLYLASMEGRQTDLLVKLLRNTAGVTSLHELADEVSKAATDSPLGSERGIDDQVEKPWLEYLLRVVPKRRAARIFAACELPESFDGAGALIMPRPTNFAPLPFGTRAEELQIDHMIPAAAGGTSEPAEETIVNLAPIPAALNRAVGTLPCDAKLLGVPGAVARYAPLASGTYIAKRGGTAVRPHPYIQWLVETHAPAHSAAELNDKQGLTATPGLGRNPSSVGYQRLAWLVELLMTRL